ncbi:MAG: TatD family hydrolase [Desulfobacterales bacterium]|nr:TatD family hydrolase [Desulfobacterales bacterium]
MNLFDSHCHINDPVFDPDFDEMMERAADQGVRAMMIAGVDLDTVSRALELTRAHAHIIAAVGLHPHDAVHCTPELLDQFTDMAKENPSVKAWGEIGLDFNRMFSPREIQETVFIEQMQRAEALDLPLIFHERDSNGRFYEILKAEGPASRRGVIHCFSGNREELFKYLDLGYHIGITGILTIQQRGAHLRELAPLIPEDRILIETDAPYLTPKPQKNKHRRNEPAFVKSVLLRLAEIRNVDAEALAQTVFDNTQRLYNTHF